MNSRQDLVGATLVVARAGIVHDVETGRDKPVPYKGCPGPCMNSRQDLVGATLVVARAGIVHDVETGRDKPVPYSPYNFVTLPCVMRSRSSVGTPSNISSRTSREQGQVESTWG